MLPAEDEFYESSVLEGPHHLPDMEVGDVGCLVGLGGEILVDDDDSLLQEVPVDDLLLAFRDLDHSGELY